MYDYKVNQVSYEEMVALQEANDITNDMTKERYDWLYFSNPFGDGFFYCAYDEGRLVGTQVSLPLDMNIGGKQIKTVMSMNSLIDSSCRGKGVWKKLINMNHDDQLERGTACIWGFPNEASYPIFVNKVGWKDICHLHYYRCIMDTDEGASLGRKVAETGLSIFTKLSTKGKRGKLRSSLSEFDLNTIGTFEGEISVYQSKEYIRWRFIDIPESPYSLRTIRDNSDNPVGFVVYRERDQIMHVFDYQIAKSEFEADLPLLLQQECLERRLRRIDICLASSSNAIKDFEDAKFIKREGLIVGGRVFDAAIGDTFGQPWQINMADLDIHFNKSFE